MKSYNLQLNEAELQLVFMALSDMKLRDSFSTYISIQNQIKSQTEKEKEKK